jgi:hypothetical protein
MVRLQRRGLLGAGGGVAGGKQPVEFLLGKRTVEPAQQKVRRPRQRNLAERNSQRKLEGRAGVSLKGALDFATARAGGLSDDQQASVGLAASWRPHQIAQAASSACASAASWK